MVHDAVGDGGGHRGGDGGAGDQPAAGQLPVLGGVALGPQSLHGDVMDDVLGVQVVVPADEEHALPQRGLHVGGVAAELDLLGLGSGSAAVGVEGDGQRGHVAQPDAAEAVQSEADVVHPVHGHQLTGHDLLLARRVGVGGKEDVKAEVRVGVQAEVLLGKGDGGLTHGMQLRLLPVLGQGQGHFHGGILDLVLHVLVGDGDILAAGGGQSGGSRVRLFLGFAVKGGVGVGIALGGDLQGDLAVAGDFNLVALAVQEGHRGGAGEGHGGRVGIGGGDVEAHAVQDGQGGAGHGAVEITGAGDLGDDALAEVQGTDGVAVALAQHGAAGQPAPGVLGVLGQDLHGQHVVGYGVNVRRAVAEDLGALQIGGFLVALVVVVVAVVVLLLELGPVGVEGEVAGHGLAEVILAAVFGGGEPAQELVVVAGGIRRPGDGLALRHGDGGQGALVAVVEIEGHGEGGAQLDGFPEALVHHAGDDRRHLAALDGAVGGIGPGVVDADDDARAVEPVDGARVGVARLHVGDRVVGDAVDGLQGLVGEDGGQERGKLPAGRRGVHGQVTALQGGVGLDVVRVHLIPGLALHEVRVLAVVDRVQAGGHGQGLGDGHVAAHAEGAVALADHESELVDGRDVLTVPVALGHVGEGPGRVALDLLEAVQTRCRRAEERKAQAQAEQQAKQLPSVRFHWVASL